MPEDQEKLLTDKVENSGAETIADTKEQLAEMYLNLLDKQKGGILATGAGVGVNLNPLQKDAVEYLTKDAKKEKTDIFSNIFKNIKKKFVERFSGGTFLEYDKKSLNKMKALITANKDNQAKLEELMAQIQDGIDPTLENTATPVATSEKSPIDSPIKAGPEMGALLGGSLVVISQSDIDVLTSEKEKIKPEITGDFASIKKVENTQGKVILEGTGESPYIHKDVRPDLLTLALVFYQKTGQTLSINSAFRTHANQEKLKKQDKENTATPGYSGHETGRSFDVETQDRYTEKIGGIAGFQEIAKKCRFTPLKGEDWHFDHESLPKADDRPAIAQVLDKEYQEKIAA